MDRHSVAALEEIPNLALPVFLAVFLQCILGHPHLLILLASLQRGETCTKKESVNLDLCVHSFAHKSCCGFLPFN